MTDGRNLGQSYIVNLARNLRSTRTSWHWRIDLYKRNPFLPRIHKSACSCDEWCLLSGTNFPLSLSPKHCGTLTRKIGFKLNKRDEYFILNPSISIRWLVVRGQENIFYSALILIVNNMLWRSDQWQIKWLSDRMMVAKCVWHPNERVQCWLWTPSWRLRGSCCGGLNG